MKPETNYYFSWAFKAPNNPPNIDLNRSDYTVHIIHVTLTQLFLHISLALQPFFGTIQPK